jgi:prepilin-type N-terminal cleavage/methylation domain-containing protein
MCNGMLTIPAALIERRLFSRFDTQSHANETFPPETASHNRFSVKSGFTLLEILIVVTIISILIASAAPSFRAMYIETIQQDSITRLVTVLRTAQNLAVIHRLQIEVLFDADKQQYQIVPDPEMVKDMRVTPKYARVHQLPDGMKFSKLVFNTDDQEDPNLKIKSVNFYSNGSSDGGTIEIYNMKRKKTTKITIRKTTGSVILDEAQDTTKPSTGDNNTIQ